MSTITSYTLAPMQGVNHVYTVHQTTLSSKKTLVFHMKGEEVKAILGSTTHSAKVNKYAGTDIAYPDTMSLLSPQTFNLPGSCNSYIPRLKLVCTPGS